MKTMQISIFLENSPGSMAEPAKLLGEKGINILGLSLSTVETRFNYGILRLIVDSPGKAYQVLSTRDFTVIVEDVVAVEVSNIPGILAKITDILSNEDLNIEYIYACNIRRSGDNIVLILGMIKTDEAIALLQKAGMNVLQREELS